eukprot:scaffold3450_cov323-Prasinococcus_capsulatus_cf.AAC.7
MRLVLRAARESGADVQPVPASPHAPAAQAPARSMDPGAAGGQTGASTAWQAGDDAALAGVLKDQGPLELVVYEHRRLVEVADVGQVHVLRQRGQALQRLRAVAPPAAAAAR